jgi:hypothetical protein
MEIEQRYVVSSLHREGTRLPEIVSELASLYQKGVFD